MSDRPLLRGRSAARARSAAQRFSAAALAAPFGARFDGFDLCDGDAGLALVHAGLEQAFPGVGHVSHAQSALSSAIRAVGAGAPDGSLGSGLTGVAWVAELLCDDDGDDGGDVDATLEAALASGAWRSFDLLAGLAGIGVYALERLPRASAKRLLAAVVDALERSSVALPGGLAWRTDAAWVDPSLRDVPVLEWNLGVAHGAPGVIAVLGRICASGASSATKAKARILLDGAVAWVLAQQLPAEHGGCFPLAVGDGVARERARCAWCYGDPGVAAALLVAAQCTGEDDWARAARRIALVSAARDEDDSGVEDAGLCHGAAGLGHVYHRLYRGTGEERLARTARAWMMRAVAMAEDGARFVWNAVEDEGRVSHPGLLTGGGGVALALLAATGDADAAWDRALGISASEAPAQA